MVEDIPDSEDEDQPLQGQCFIGKDNSTKLSKHVGT